MTVSRPCAARLALAFALLLAGQAVQAGQKVESSKKFLQRCRKAEGGKALSKVRSCLLEGRATDAGGQTGRFSLLAQAPDRFRLELEIGGRTLGQGYSGTSAWVQQSEGVSTAEEEEADFLKLAALLANHRWAEPSKSRLAVSPEAAAGRWQDRATATLEITLGRARCRLHADPSTGRLVGVESLPLPSAFRLSFADHRAADRVLEPRTICWEGPAGRFTLAVETVRHNAPLAAARFAVPVPPGSQAVPDLPALLDSLMKNQEAMEKRWEQYTFRKTEKTWKRDKQGKETLDTECLYEVTPVAGHRVARLIEENGKRLSEKAQAAEDRRVEKEAEKAAARREEEGGIRLTAADFLRCCELVSPRREKRQGHELLMFEFVPKAGLKPRNRAEDLVGKLAGSIWVDEAERMVVRLEAHLTDDFSMGKGLLGKVNAGSVVIEHAKVNGEVWLPSYEELDIAARVLLFFRVDIHQVVRYGDYQKVVSRIDYGQADPS